MSAADAVAESADSALDVSGQSGEHAENAAPTRTVWLDRSGVVCVIDQKRLPFEMIVKEITSVASMAESIQDMTVRGAGCIGVCAGFGMYLAAVETATMGGEEADAHLHRSGGELTATRPTAVNLAWAVRRQLDAVVGISDGPQRIAVAERVATDISAEDVESCRRIGEHGLVLITGLYERTQRPVRILTHCNAGWLAFVEHGSATAPIYAAHDAGIPVEVIVGETRPRSQGALTAWELAQRGIDHTYVVDNAVGHFIQRGEVDLVVTGADRVTADGYAANKIGTYLRAIAASVHGVPFYVALPSSTFDMESGNGFDDIEIEERPGDEVSRVSVSTDSGMVTGAVVAGTPNTANPAFDVTPPHLITGLITERGICRADRSSIDAMFGDLSSATLANGMPR